jgi:hypothetical protein
MTCYSAHLLFYVKSKKHRQTRYPVWENIVLISARTVDEAFEKAEKRAMEDPCMDPDDTLTWGGKPAEWIYGGIRKLTTCVDEDDRPEDGTEVTYLEYEIASKADLETLMNSDHVRITIRDGFPDDEQIEAESAVSANGRKR